MTFKRENVPEPENSTLYMAATPSESVNADLLDDHDRFGAAKPSSSSMPYPGATFIISSVSSGCVITLLEGKIVLDRPGGGGSIHWECVENTNDWLGFRNPISDRFLGRDEKWRLCCSAESYREREKFSVHQRMERGYILLMTH